MGNSNSENQYKEQIIKQLKNQINNLKNSIKNYITEYIPYRNEIINKIDLAFKNTIIDIENIINSKTIIKSNENKDRINFKNEEIEQIEDITHKNNEIKKYNYFDRKDIQLKNLAITRDFENRCSDYIVDEDKIENNSIALFLLDIAKLSRLSLNKSNEFLKFLYCKYKEENKKTDNKMATIITSDQFKKEFSSWVKDNDDIVENYLDNYLNKCDLSFIMERGDKEKKYFSKLYKELIILYYQCELSIPTVEVSFEVDKGNIFNGKKMIDIVNNGNNRKVNFVFFPSLYSNGNYIQNGMQWVFTYINSAKKKTFYFDKLDLDDIKNENNKFSIPKLSDELELKVKSVNYLVAQLNYNISDKLKKKYIFYFKNKSNNNIVTIPVENKTIEIDENLEFIGCDFILMGEKICEQKIKIGK